MRNALIMLALCGAAAPVGAQFTTTYTGVQHVNDKDYPATAIFAIENGRIAARPGSDLNLVHLRGPGALLLRTRGAVVALDVQPNRPVRIPIAALVGFAGAVTPRVLALFDPAGPEPLRPEALAVELSGTGRVLVDEGAAA